MNKTIFLILISFLFSSNSLFSQSHNLNSIMSQCRYAKKPANFNYEGATPCPACADLDKKDKEAKKAEDKRRLTENKANQLAAKEALAVSEANRLKKEEAEARDARVAALVKEKEIKDKTVVAQAKGGTSELLNVLVEGDRGDQKIVRFTVPSGVSFMEVILQEGGVGSKNSADLFVRRTINPTVSFKQYSHYTWEADCASTNLNRAQELCTFTNPQSGEWVVLVGCIDNCNYFSSNLVVKITQ
ncbi:hypothetical protein ATE92_2066 [Ulvibacter sp. MAR_2010_11]|uniref:PPC domain-containing protein n=1 Tax=Ulvibacter sp. MAR_2010_11 TaxID=1250229 RepID=UPI000CB4D029|nr:PPC domain-containing protein [Ulvibacter sp. MAR_2010_11]PKA83897.1 hypothetical protein ATE92_2066 [Ulvibacter sp. MAR_2010_11]